ncbi:MAG: hypothetical protein ABWY27_03185 [Telluria sp.]
MHIKTLIAVVALAAWSGLAGAKLPPPTPRPKRTSSCCWRSTMN